MKVRLSESVEPMTYWPWRRFCRNTSTERSERQVCSRHPVWRREEGGG